MPDLAHYFSKPASQDFLVCRNCGVGYTHSPDAAATDSYESDYYLGYDDFLQGTNAYLAREKLFDQRAQEIADLFGRGGHVLDIGCAIGHFMDVARGKGLAAYGVDVSKYAVRKAIQKWHSAIVSSAYTLPFSSNRFQCVHMNHVLEHLDDPIAALREVCRVLDKPGLLIAEVPNEIGTLAFRIKSLVGRTKRNGSVFGQSKPRRYVPHILYFTPRALIRLLHSCGFARIRLRSRAYRAGTRPRNVKQLVGVVLQGIDLWLRNSDLLEVYAWKN